MPRDRPHRSRVVDFDKMISGRRQANLSGRRVGDRAARAIARLLDDNQELELLNLGGNRLSDAGLADICRALHGCRSLQTLLLYANSINAEGLEVILSLVEAHPTLSALNLGRNDLGDDGAKLVAAVVVKATHLRSLELYSNEVGPDGTAALGAVLETNVSLRELKLYDNRLGDAGCKTICQALRANKALRHLDINGNGIGDQGARHFRAALADNDVLETLDLFNNTIGAAGMSAVASGLSHNPALLSLNVGRNNIGPAGAQALSRCLTYNHSLTKLDAYDNALGDEGVSQLGAALGVNNGLTTLNLRNNGITDAGAKALAAHLSTNLTLTTLYLHRNDIAHQLQQDLSSFLATNKSSRLQQRDLDFFGSVTIERLRVSAALNLSHLDIQTFTPKQLPTADLGFLSILRIHAHLVTAVPAGISSMASLTQLFLTNNHIETLCAADFAGLAQLRVLDVSDNPLADLPDGVFDGLPLEELRLRRCRLTTLAALAACERLQRLDASGNPLSDLSHIGRLERLRHLRAARCRLTTLEALLGLAQLQTIDVTGNPIPFIPPELFRLPLRKLLMAECEVQLVPSQVKVCTDLAQVDLSFNPVDRLPPQLGHLPITELLIEGCPLSRIPEEVRSGGRNAILGYLRDLDRAEPVYRSRLLMLGYGAVGKTTLLDALVPVTGPLKVRRRMGWSDRHAAIRAGNLVIYSNSEAREELRSIPLANARIDTQDEHDESMAGSGPNSPRTFAEDPLSPESKATSPTRAVGAFALPPGSSQRGDSHPSLPIPAARLESLTGGAAGSSGSSGGEAGGSPGSPSGGGSSGGAAGGGSPSPLRATRGRSSSWAVMAVSGGYSSATLGGNPLLSSVAGSRHIWKVAGADGSTLTLKCANAAEMGEWVAGAKRQVRNTATDGISIRRWVVAADDIALAATMDPLHERGAATCRVPPGTKMEVSAWDFAGQEAYHEGHQLFMSHRAVYVIAWDMDPDHLGEIDARSPGDSHVLHGRRGALRELGFWVRAVQAHLGDVGVEEAAVFIVGTKLDKTSPSESASDRRHQVERVVKQSGLTAPCRISEVCCIGDRQTGVSELRRQILSVMGRQAHMGEEVPRAYLHVSNLLAERRGELILGSKNALATALIPVIQSADLLSGTILDPGQLDRALRLLHLWGECVCMDKSVILHPQWLTVSVVAGLLRYARSHSSATPGLISNVDLRHAWHGFDDLLTEELANLLEQHGLLIRHVPVGDGPEAREETASTHFLERRSLVPAALPPLPPGDLLFDEEPGTSLSCEYQLSFVVPGLIGKAMYGLRSAGVSLVGECCWHAGIVAAQGAHRILVRIDEPHKRLHLISNGPEENGLELMVTAREVVLSVLAQHRGVVVELVRDSTESAADGPSEGVPAEVALPRWVAVSYAYADRKLALSVRAALRNRELRCHLDVDKAGDNLCAASAALLAGAEALVVCVSEEYVHSGFHQEELHRAAEAGVKLVPVMLEPTTLSGAAETLLAGFEGRVELWKPDIDGMDALGDLVERALDEQQLAAVRETDSGRSASGDSTDDETDDDADSGGSGKHMTPLMSTSMDDLGKLMPSASLVRTVRRLEKRVEELEKALQHQDPLLQALAAGHITQDFYDRQIKIRMLRERLGDQGEISVEARRRYRAKLEELELL